MKKHQLQTDLHNISLNNCKIIDYLLHIQMLVDSVISISDLVLQSEHAGIILEVLPTEYESIMTFVYNKSKPI